MKPLTHALRSLVLALISSTTLLQASLVWETTAQEARADFGQEEVAFSFGFKNEGPTPITIESIDVSCDCTAASLDQRTYAPGESGVVEVLYRPDGQTGPQSKTVTVTTSEEPERPITLTLKVDVPRLFDIAPRHVTWPLGGEPVEKVVSIRLHRNPQTTVAVMDAVQDSIAVSLQPGEKPGEHLLRIRPKSTATAFRAIVRLRIESDGLPTQVLAVYADLR
jgi:hypothetical protein